MPKTHLVLQGKGGVGKSFCAATLAQWLRSKGRSPTCIDTDPVNGTFAGYAGLDVSHVDIMDGDEINSRHFDNVIERVASSDDDVVIDNGASSFVPLSHYLLSNGVPALLASLDRRLLVHVVITGGQAMLDTMNGFAQLAEQFGDSVNFVVWLNPFWGPIVHDGKGFEDSRAYCAHRSRVTAIVRVPPLKPETFGTDLANLLRARRTFEEALAEPGRTIMERQRLKTIKDTLFAQLDGAHL